jgi:hypothetical protein
MPITKNIGEATIITLGQGDVSTGFGIAHNQATGRPEIGGCYFALVPAGSPVPAVLFFFDTEVALEKLHATIGHMLNEYRRAVIESVQEAEIVSPEKEVAHAHR